MTIFGNALANLEESLIPIFIGIMEDELEKDPNCKVILCMNRKKNVQKVYDHMSERYKRIMKITENSFKNGMKIMTGHKQEILP